MNCRKIKVTKYIFSKLNEVKLLRMGYYKITTMRNMISI